MQRLIGGMALAAMVSASPANAYRFYAQLPADGSPSRAIVGIEHAIRWSPDIWPAGGTLTFHVVSDSGYDGPMEGYWEALKIAMAEWADLPEVDVSWRAVLTNERELRSDERRERNLVILSTEPGPPRAGHSTTLGPDGREFTSCSIWLPVIYRESEAIGVLVHELGHCLGLLHAGSTPMTGENRRTELWEFDAAMAYGRNFHGRITFDDIVGASLLRPVPAYLAGTGSVEGRVVIAGSGGEVAHANVWFARIHEGRLSDQGVGAFTNEDGEYVLEGLPAGQYLVSVLPLISTGAHRDIQENATRDFRDTVSFQSVSIAAGATVRVPDVTVVQGPRPKEP